MQYNWASKGLLNMTTYVMFLVLSHSDNKKKTKISEEMQF